MATRRSIPNASNVCEYFAGLRNDYDAAKSSRFRRTRTGISTSGTGADYHYKSESDYLRMMEFSRDLDRNNVVVGQGINRLVNNVLRDGMNLDVQTGDKKLDRDLMDRWADWAGDPDQCDSSGELTFREIERLALRQMLVDGDVLFLGLDMIQQSGGTPGALEAIEGHRIRTPSGTTKNVVHGFLLDNHRRRLQVWVSKDEIDPYKQIKYVRDMHQYDIRDTDGNRQVFQLYKPSRFSQTRGVTVMAPIFDMAGMHDDIQFAKLVHQQVVSAFALIEEVDATVDHPGAAPDLGAISDLTLGDGSVTTLENIGPGMRIRMPRGVKAQMDSPKVPNAEYFDHAMMILSLIAINLDLPVHVLLLDPSKTNFSGWRGAIDQARMGFQALQRREINLLNTPAYLWKLRQWLASDPALRRASLRTDIRMAKHRWNPPTWQYIEPMKDAKANEIRVKGHQTSLRRMLSEQGSDIDDIANEIAEDNILLIEKAHERAAAFNKQFPDAEPVTWKDVLYLQSGSPGSTGSLSTGTPGTPAPAEGIEPQRRKGTKV